MSRISFTLYLDESGDDILHSEEEYSRNTVLESHCTLVGMIIGNDKKEMLSERLTQLKTDIWKTKKIIFHSVDIRNKRGSFALFHYQPDLYEQFKLQKLVSLRMNTLAMVISKRQARRIPVEHAAQVHESTRRSFSRESSRDCRLPRPNPKSV